ncbi:ProQ/FinO family protein [Rhizobium sp. 007]|uniref:ProQ/FinO family protein n=1 Tax=Rhizobium sp. 007 TaxID=2785056 RepID=UPI00188DCDC1|nr:ProQ/FinO family protein [Rhizobium sp. 007]QPB24198.1 ProQ/FinO family protein [Rhizobium sp. 007]
MQKLWTESRGVIAAGPNEIGKAEAINALLVRPIELLPRREGDAIKPFALGIWTEIRALLMKPDLPVSALRRATSVYTHSKRYYFACAQPDAKRHDVDGNPVGPVSDEDRLAAQTTALSLKANSTPASSPAVADIGTPKSNLIRAGTFGRNRDVPPVS